MNLRPCRILFIIGQLGLGGQERQLYYLLATLDREQYLPAVVAWNYDSSERYVKEIDALGVPIYGLGESRSSISRLVRLRGLVKRLSPEVIHSSGFYTNFAAYFASVGTGAVAIGSIRSDLHYATKAGGLVQGVLNSKWPSLHIVNSDACARAIRRASSVTTSKRVAVVRNGLDMNRFSRQEQSIVGGGYIGSAGALLPVKRWDRLLRVASIVRNACGSRVRFHLAGDGPLKKALEAQAKSFDLSETVRLVGAVHDIPLFLKQAKLLVHTSESEGCPNVVMEAMASGLPVVAMEAGDISSLVEDGRTGFVVPQGDEEACADRIARLLADHDLCREMGAAARKKAEHEFRLERLLSETLEAYKSAGWDDRKLEMKNSLPYSRMALKS